MIENLLKQLSDGNLAVGLVSVLVAFNLVLSGASKLLDLFKDKTATQADNKAHAFLVKSINAIQKVIDWMGGNRAHKPEVK